MKDDIFTPDQFTAYLKDSTGTSQIEKARFANQFVRFVRSGFAAEQFPKWFYVRLSMTFGHIAHYNREGFYGTFFIDTANVVRFLEQTLEYPCFGSPEFTYSDVEMAIRNWLAGEHVLETYLRRLAQQIEATE